MVLQNNSSNGGEGRKKGIIAMSSDNKGGSHITRENNPFGRARGAFPASDKVLVIRGGWVEAEGVGGGEGNFSVP